MTQAASVGASGLIDFNFLWQRHTKEGARGVFEQLAEQVVGLMHPDVRSVQANPGDWGIDAYVGELHEEERVSIWQAKYFIEGFGKVQQAEVREAYTSAKAAAAREGYAIDAWTLCLPIYLDGPMSKWWAGKKRAWEREDGVIVDLWDEGRLRRMIMQQTPEARAVYAHYFNPAVPVRLVDGDVHAAAFGQVSETDGRDGESDTDPQISTVEMLEDPERYEEALFVKQMQAANLHETRFAREAFYNAEILSHEVSDKGIAQEVHGLRAWRSSIGSTWERHFNDLASRDTSGILLDGLYRGVTDAVDAGHREFGPMLRAAAIHGQGLLHQQVDDGEAGWTRGWRSCRDEYRAAAAPTAVVHDTHNIPIEAADNASAPAAPADQEDHLSPQDSEEAVAPSRAGPSSDVGPAAITVVVEP